MIKCEGCGRVIRFWHEKGFNSSWHRKCTEIWLKGYAAAFKFCEDENKIAGYSSPSKLYCERNAYSYKQTNE